MATTKIVLITMGNGIMNKELKKGRITDVNSIKEIADPSKIEVVKIRKASMSQPNRYKIDKLLEGLKVENHDIQPIQAGHSDAVAGKMVENYKRKTQVRIEVKAEDTAILEALVKKYNKSSIMHEIRKIK